MDKILSNQVSLPKTKLNISILNRNATSKKMIPLRLVLLDEEKKLIKTVELDDSFDDEIIIPNPRDSFIEYMQECTGPEKLHSITVQAFLDRGFPMKKDVVDTDYLQGLAEKSRVTIKQFILTDKEGNIDKIIPFSLHLHELQLRDKTLCKVVYDKEWGDKNVSVRLDNLLSAKKFPAQAVKTLTFMSLECCIGFTDIELVGFQSDKKSTKVKPLTKENFIEYEYSYAKDCFVYFSSKADPKKVTHNVRLDNLLERGYFPHIAFDASQLFATQKEEDHAPAQEAVTNNDFIKMVKDVHEFLYSFKERTCCTCNNKWYFTDMPVPGNVQLDILNQKKNPTPFKFSLVDENECDRCRLDVPPVGLPKMFSAANGMDFGPTFPAIDALTTMEEMLVARVSTLVSVVTLTSTGYLSYQGHSVNFFQSTVEWFNTIPRRASACEMLLIVRKGTPASQRRKAFKVSRTRLLAAIKTLAEVNPHYAPDKVNIDWDYLNSLPEDDIPMDANIIEREMSDDITLKKELVDKWLELAKPIGNRVLEFAFSRNIMPSNCFDFLCETIHGKNSDHTSFDSKQLLELLLQNGLMEKKKQWG